MTRPTPSNNRPREPVASSIYDDKWIESAWGEDNVRQLIEQETIKPRPRVQRAIELLDLKPGLTLLDIACGRGEIPAIAADAGCYGVGIDYSTSILNVALKVKQYRQKRVSTDYPMQLIQADATRLPFKSESFDRITMLDIIEHLTPTQLDAMYTEVRRLLKPNGYAVIHTLPNRWVYEIGYRWASKIIRRLPAQPRSEIEQQIHINEQDIIGLHRQLTHCQLNHRIWLEQHMPKQARWNAEQTRFNDNRDTLYPVLAGPVGRALDLASMTPAKLLLSNDIFGILWKAGSNPCRARLPLALSEKITCGVFGNSGRKAGAE